MPERSVADAFGRAVDRIRANFLRLLLLGLLLQLPTAVAWLILGRFVQSRVSLNVDLAALLRLIAGVGAAAVAVLLFTLLLEALLWGAMSEFFARRDRAEPASVGVALSEAGAKYKDYLATYFAFVIPVGTVCAATMALIVPVILAPSFFTGALLVFGTMAAIPFYVWASGFVFLVVPAIVRGQFGMAAFRTFWNELRGEWLGIAGLELMTIAVWFALLIAGGVLKFFLPAAPAFDWQKLVGITTLEEVKRMLPLLLQQPVDWRDLLRDGVDVVRDALVFVFSAALALEWYAGKRE